MRPSTGLGVLATLLALVAGGLFSPAPVQAAPTRVTVWAPADEATIKPGVQMFTEGVQCTGNFVFSDAVGRVYLGYAAHCAGTGGATDTNGCTTGSHPVGTRVRFASGATLVTSGVTVGRGTLVYSSWLAMRQDRGVSGHACAANDFALVRVDAADVRKVNPSVPFWGGPTALGDGSTVGDTVHTWGQSSLRPTTALSPKTGAVLARTDDGWGWDVYTATPGVPGDSGSGVLDSRGRAFGTLSTIAVTPVAGANGLGDLARELRYARDHSGIDGLRLVPGTEPFRAVP